MKPSHLNIAVVLDSGFTVRPSSSRMSRTIRDSYYCDSFGTVRVNSNLFFVFSDVNKKNTRDLKIAAPFCSLLVLCTVSYGTVREKNPVIKVLSGIFSLGRDRSACMLNYDVLLV